MTGEAIYTIYCASASLLPDHVTRGEALPAWAFLTTEQKRMWSRIGDQVEAKS